MVNGFFRYAKRDRLFGRRRNMREDPTIRSRKGGRAAKAVLRILLFQDTFSECFTYIPVVFILEYIHVFRQRYYSDSIRSKFKFTFCRF